jgi:hypothetical protein
MRRECQAARQDIAGGSVCTHRHAASYKGSLRSQVVGNSVSGDGTVGHTFLWENDHILNLNVFVPPDSGLTLVDAVNIHDREEIWGNAVRSDGTHRAFLLIPVGDDDPHGITASLQEVALPATSAPTSSAVTAAIRARFFRRY